MGKARTTDYDRVKAIGAGDISATGAQPWVLLSAAGIGGVPVGGFYRNGSVVQIRVA